MAESTVYASDEEEARRLAEQGLGTKRKSVELPIDSDWEIIAVKSEKDKDW